MPTHSPARVPGRCPVRSARSGQKNRTASPRARSKVPIADAAARGKSTLSLAPAAGTARPDPVEPESDMNNALSTVIAWMLLALALAVVFFILLSPTGSFAH